MVNGWFGMVVWIPGIPLVKVIVAIFWVEFQKNKQFLKTQSSPSHGTDYNYISSTNFPIGIQPD